MRVVKMLALDTGISTPLSDREWKPKTMDEALTAIKYLQNTIRIKDKRYTNLSQDCSLLQERIKLLKGLVGFEVFT